MSFSIDMTKIAKSMKSDLDEVVTGIKIELFNSVILDTRVDTGRLRGNWQTTTGSPASGEISRISRKKQGEEGGASFNEVKKVVKPDTVDYLTNNLPYAEVYEEKDAMIATNLTRINRNIKEQIRNL